MNLKCAFLIISVGFLFFSCSKKNDLIDDPVIINAEKEFTSFKIEAELNKHYISETIEGEIKEDHIVLNIYQFTDISHLIASFEFRGTVVEVGNEKQNSGESLMDFTRPVVYTIVAENGSKKDFPIKIVWIQSLKTKLPHLYIDTDNNASIDREEYVGGGLRIDGKDEFDNYEGRMKIRGRGNTSWDYRKKPYKIKLEQKASLLGLASYKEWVLLAEFLDGSMLYNSIPYTIARQVGIPYTNHIIPIEVTLNGQYQGIYALTEQKEVGPKRIDIGRDGLLLELDSYYDEDWKFKSAHYQLPVMVQYPEKEDMTVARLEQIQTEFNLMEDYVYNEDYEYLNYFDDTSFVNYMLVYLMTDNEELNHPKSVYINKPANGKYRMGIIWDFDWAYGYERDTRHYLTSNYPLFWGTDYRSEYPGTRFFGKIMTDPHIRSLFKEKWNWYKENKYVELKQYVTDYSSLIRQAISADHQVWGSRDSSGDADTDLNRVQNWLDGRVNYIDTYIAGW